MGQEARKFDAMKGQVLANLAEMLVRQLEEKWVNALQVGLILWQPSKAPLAPELLLPLGLCSLRAALC